MEFILTSIGIILAAAAYGVIFNPFFWQGFRNTKYWDEMKHDNWVDPDSSNKEIDEK